MVDPIQTERGLFIAQLVGGELSMEDPRVHERLELDPELDAEVKGLMGMIGAIESGAEMRRNALDCPAGDALDEEEVLSGFRAHMAQSAQPPVVSELVSAVDASPGPLEAPQSASMQVLWRAAALLLVLLTGFAALRSGQFQSSAEPLASAVYLEGDETISIVEGLPFGTVQWNLSDADLFSRVSVRVHSLPAQEGIGEPEQIEFLDEITASMVQLSSGQLGGLKRIRFEIEVRADGELMPRRRTVVQER